jgi:hypothetical protein
MAVYSAYHRDLRAKIEATLDAVTTKAANYAAKCTARQMYNSVSPALLKSVQMVRDEIAVNKLTDTSVMFLIMNGMADDSDELWSMFPIHHSPL